MFDEMYKLIGMLEKAGFPFTCALCQGGLQVRLFADEDCTQEIDDCICHPYSHGYDFGLLETYHLHDCLGYETAEQVFEGWRKMYAQSQRGKNKDFPIYYLTN